MPFRKWTGFKQLRSVSRKLSYDVENFANRVCVLHLDADESGCM